MTPIRSFASRVLSASKYPRRGESLFNFTVKDTHEIPELDLVLVKLMHEPTGATHIHLAREDPNNVFCVAFKTPPSDSTGLPHILEHTTLCGSTKYPVRDPFFKMLNRSLASYMNAWTASEHTAYPFCTANRQDYANLRDVYCDAVFFPKLSEFDFLQEGWRLEADDPQSPVSPLRFKGVVYNEMKGAFSDVESLFAQRLQQHMFQGSVYGHVSGGDPAAIVDLTHEHLVQFHRKHYHPSNALFYTYGDQPLAETLSYIDDKLKTFKRSVAASIAVPDLSANLPKTLEVSCPSDPMGDPDKQCKTTVSFLMNSVTADPQETFHLRILSHLLLEGSSAPLYKALIDSNIGQEYAAGTGYDSSTKTATFSVGLQGIRDADTKLVQDTVMGVLKEVSTAGFDQARIDAVVHLLELGRKHQSAQYGLALSHSIISSWVFDVAPEADLLMDRQIALFKEAYAKGGLFEGLIEKYFLQSTKRMLFTMKPDPDYNSNLEAEEAKRLAGKTEVLSGAEKARLFERNRKLIGLQEQTEDLSALPCLSIGDVDKAAKVVSFAEFHHQAAPKVFWRNTAKTNGISSFTTIIPLKHISASQVRVLPLVCQALTDLGVHGKTLAQYDSDIKLHTGGLNSSTLIGRRPFGDAGAPEISLVASTSALDRNVPKALDLLAEALTKTDFSNLSRLKTIITANASSMMNSIASAGHMFAISKAASSLNLHSKLHDVMSGLDQVRFINDLATKENLESLAADLKSISESIRGSNVDGWRSAVVATSESVASIAQVHKLAHSLHLPASSSQAAPLVLQLEKANEFIPMPFATNFAAKVFQFNPYDLKECANLAVLSKLFRFALLHKEIREKGGAYGAGASVSTHKGLFSFYSYRDPNPANSMRVFDSAPEWFLNRRLTDQELMEAKLSVFSALDAPEDVASEGLQKFTYGITNVDRQLYREQLFAVDASGLKETAEKMCSAGGFEARRCTIGQAMS